MMEKTNISDIS